MRRVRRKGGNKEKVFGCDLLDHLTASCQEIPQVLRSCSEFVERNGIVDGIYRLSGVSSNIQKLRGEFETDGGPDLNKDVYLQDIHCVSSLCKAYFRELPNPLLTYQLYDKFAEAVAIQLEEERLVKIRDVLKELPEPHHRTLEFLMRHLVRMASFSSETNMHARNLAIVWAPNLLRSKDIETSGFNGTAAFMEVRVQSIVVEFILTHVPQLFPQQGVSHERRTSLPSPSAVPLQEEALFKSVSTQPVAHFGNISPGDGPLPIRPYHAIIEGTDKRKGSLRGRKWMSIFNIGGRFNDQRRRHKHSGKGKEKPVLRPARSMDSLSTPSYPKEGLKPPAQRPPSTHMSAKVTPTPQSASDVAVSTAPMGGSEYAVTYRRGTGIVSGGGTQGTYTTLDPEGIAGNETVQSRSPGLSTKVGRRAAMHITGPTIVSVPLHITSTLALEVLKGCGGDRVIHRGRDKEGVERVEMRKGGQKTEKEPIKEIQQKVEVNTKAAGETGCREENNRQGVVVLESSTKAPDDTGEQHVVAEREEDDESERNSKQESMATFQSESTEPRQESLSSNSEDQSDSDYTVMKRPELDCSQKQGDRLLKASDVFISTDMGEDDQELSGYVQDNFEFLDQMDCSVLEHMDCSVSYQVNEFSVEPPGHSDDEYEMMHPFSHQPTEQQTHLQLSPATHTWSQTELKPHRPLSLDLHSRHGKSLSLPRIISPSQGAEESSSEEDSANDDSDDILSSYEEDDNMFVKSLPSDFFLCTMTGLEADGRTEDGPVGSPAHHPQRSDGQSQPPNIELPVCIESVTGDTENKDGLKGQAVATSEEDDQVPQMQEVLDNIAQSEAKEDERLFVTDAGSEEAQSADSTPCCGEFPQPSGEDSDVEVLHQGSTHVAEEDAFPAALEENSRRLSVTSAEHPVDRGDPSEGDGDEREDTSQQFAQASDKNNETHDKPIRRMSEGFTDESHEYSKEWDSAMGVDIWDELENVVIEVIEYEERKQLKRGDATGAAEVENDDDDEAESSVEILPEAEPGKKANIDIGVEVEEESLQMKGKKPTEPVLQEDFVEYETHSPKGCDHEEVKQSQAAIHVDVENHSRAEVTKQPAKEICEPPVSSGLGKQLKEVTDFTESKKSGPSVEGVTRKLVVSKHPKVYQVKAVPVVPPKPQHCKITALNLRQQQRERKDAERSNESPGEVLADGDAVCTEQNLDENAEMKSRLQFRGGDKERDRRRDRPDGAMKDVSRNSPLSMCFDEAVAIATMRREKERREGEAESEGLGK